MKEETYEKQMEDSDTIFTAVSTGDFDNYKDAESIVAMAYVTDMSFSRAGIAHALKRLEKYYREWQFYKAKTAPQPD